MKNAETKKRFIVFLKAGLPYTIVGVLIVFAGMAAIRKWLGQSDYQNVLLFGWLALFWLVYQPLFRRRIEKVRQQMQ